MKTRKGNDAIMSVKTDLPLESKTPKVRKSRPKKPDVPVTLNPKVKRYALASHALDLLRICGKSINASVSSGLTKRFGVQPLHGYRIGNFWVDKGSRTVERIDVAMIEATFERLAELGRWDENKRKRIHESLFRVSPDAKGTTTLRLGKPYLSDELSELGKIIKKGATPELLRSARSLVENLIVPDLEPPLQELWSILTETADRGDGSLESDCSIYDANRSFVAGLDVHTEKLRQELIETADPDKADEMGYKVSVSAPRRKPDLEGYRTMLDDPEADFPTKTTTFEVCTIMDERLYNLRASFSGRRTEQKLADGDQDLGQSQSELDELFL